MLFSIPFYVSIFQSFPENMIMILLGTSLFNLKISLRDCTIISIINTLILFLARKYLSLFGLHTLISIAAIFLLLKTICKFDTISAISTSFIGMIINGVIQSSLIPYLLKINNIQIKELRDKPILNIMFFVPCALVMMLLYFLIKKYKFYLLDLGNH